MKPVRILFDSGANSRFVTPHTALASWITSGRRSNHAANEVRAADGVDPGESLRPYLFSAISEFQKILEKR